MPEFWPQETWRREHGADIPKEELHNYVYKQKTYWGKFAPGGEAVTGVIIIRGVDTQAVEKQKELSSSHSGYDTKQAILVFIKVKHRSVYAVMLQGQSM